MKIPNHLLSIIIFLIINSLYCTTIENESESLDSFDQSKINIVGTYSGGCGFAYMTKKKHLEEIKKYLTKNYFINKDKIKVSLVDLKNKPSEYLEQFQIPNSPFNPYEFNIYLFYKNKKRFLGTSFHADKEHYYGVLQGEIGLNKTEFYNTFTAKIHNVVDEIEKEIK